MGDKNDNERAKGYELVGFSEFGKRCGASHPRSKLGEYDVELIRTLRSEHGLGIRELAEKFEVSPALISMICNYKRRAVAAVEWRKKYVDED